jgi:hypothetical protein
MLEKGGREACVLPDCLRCPTKNFRRATLATDRRVLRARVRAMGARAPPWRCALLALSLLCCARGAHALARRSPASRSLSVVSTGRPGLARPDYSYYLKAYALAARAAQTRRRAWARACWRTAHNAADRKPAGARAAARRDALAAQVRRTVAENPRTMKMDTMRAELDGCAAAAAHARSLVVAPHNQP